MKCNICKGEAYLNFKAYNIKLCKNCFIRFFERKVEKTIKKLKLFEKNEKILLAVSGGKDSMGLFYLLSRLGYDVDGLYIDLWENDFSFKEMELVKSLSESLNKNLFLVFLKKEKGFSVNELFKYTKRVPCSVCGLVKRYMINDFALKNGYNAIATGHNLDDEASVLLKNIFRWETGYFGRQSPLLEKMDGFVKKVKPYVFCYEKETLLYAEIQKIGFSKEKCPFSKGSKTNVIKKALNLIEEESPGNTLNFLKLFLKNKKYFEAFRSKEIVSLKKCKICGHLTEREICAFCTIIERSKNESSSCL